MKSDSWYKRLADKVIRYRPELVKVISDQFTGVPYMIRYLVLDLLIIKVHLHQIIRKDSEPKMHDHPWPFFHYVLEGGYVEQNYAGLHVREPGFWAFRPARYRHAIVGLSKTHWLDGYDVEAWTLVVRGPNLRHWGFHCDSGWVHHNDYERRRKENVGWEC